MSKPALTDTIIELHVPDFGKVKDFYGKLGFKVVWETKPGTLGYLVMKRGESILAYSEGNEEVYNHSYLKKFPKDTKRGYGVEIIIFVENIEEFYEKVKGFCNVTDELQMHPWGYEDFRIEDPFGYYLRFSSPYNTLLAS